MSDNDVYEDEEDGPFNEGDPSKKPPPRKKRTKAEVDAIMEAMAKEARENYKKGIVDEAPETGQLNGFKAGRDYGLRWVEGSNLWYTRALNSEEWICKPVPLVMAHLRIVHRLSDKVPKDSTNVSEAMKALHDATLKFNVYCAGSFAGYLSAGEHVINGRRVLITRPVKLIEPAQGDWEWLHGLCTHTFTEDKHGVNQADPFFGWCLNARTALESGGDWRPGQALILIGDPGLGKSALQNVLITNMLTGRDCDPSQFLMDKTSFNEQLSVSEHWKMSDPPGRRSEHFLSAVKHHVSNTSLNIHPKFKAMFDMPAYRRTTISLNGDGQALGLLQGMAKSEAEKMLILDFKDPGKYAPDAEGGLKYTEWRDRIVKEIPAFLWWLHHEFKLPNDLKDTRYGVRYSNPLIKDQLLEMSTSEVHQADLRAIVFKAVFRLDRFTDQPLDPRTGLWTQTLDAGDVLDVIKANDSPVRERSKTHDEFNDTRRLGILLTQWVNNHDGHYEDFSITEIKDEAGKRKKYQITRNG